MPRQEVAQNVADCTQGSFELRFNVGAGLPQCTVQFLARDVNSVNSDRIAGSVDLNTVLTGTEKTNLAAIVKKVMKAGIAVSFGGIDPAVLVESPNWVFTEP